MASVLWLVAASQPAFSARVGETALGSAASEESCAVSGTASAFPATTRELFFRFVLTGARAGESLAVEWVDPAGRVHTTTPYDDLPAVRSLCLLSQLPLGGSTPANQPGTWTVRVVAAGAVLASRPFQITGDPAASGILISRASPQEPDIVIEGSGFNSESIVHVAQYTSATGWRYILSAFPDSLAATRLTARIGKLDPAEYVVFVKNGQRLSAPARFLIATAGYRLPFPVQEAWVVSQPPSGGYSHWGRTQHAWDLAPRQGGCVVAMRPGIAITRDLGLGQTPHLRIFGNSITIDHEDGEFSHYAHLRTGTFRVRNGERVEQGQALAIAGNSGYSFGTHLHVQVSRSAAIATQSIPFRFEERVGNGYRGPVRSINRSPYGDCGGPKPDRPVLVTTRGKAQPQQQAALPPPTWTGAVPVAGWWSDFTRVPQGVHHLAVKLGWDSPDRDLDLHLVSPSGRHYGSYGDRTGYTASTEAPEEGFEIPNPEPGTWRVSVQGMRGNGESMPFRIYRR